MAKKTSRVDPTPPPEKKGGGVYFDPPNEDIKFIKSGCTMLDLALGGGWAQGRISNIIGDSSTGKTLLAIEACANFALQEPKGKIRYREAESAFDDAYAQALGFPVSRVEKNEQFETIEDLFEDLEKVIKGAKGPELYIVDSLDALSDRAEMERDINAGSFGAQKAKKLSELFRRQVRALAEKGITLMVISQIRDNLNAGMFGKKYMLTGGKALQFYSSQRLHLAQIKKIKRQTRGIELVTGVLVKATTEKNKIGKPYRSVEFPISFGYGIDDETACLDFLAKVKATVPKDASLKVLQRMSEEAWYEIAEALAPKTTKYGAQE